MGSFADGSGYLDLGVSLVSPDEDVLAYSVDTAGDEVFVLRFRDLRTGQDLDEVVARSYYGGAWSADSGYYFYAVHDDAYRPCEVWRHRLGTPVSEDVLVLTETDERFELNLRASRSEAAILIWSESRDTSECWLVDALAPESAPLSIGGRRPGVVYRAEHVRSQAGPGRLLLVTNDDAVEFRLMEAPIPDGEHQNASTWREVRPEEPTERIERVDAFEGFAVLSLRTQGQHRLRILPLDDLTAPGREVASSFPAGAVHIARNTSYDASAVTVVDRSYVEPPVWSDVEFASGSVTERYREDAPGHDPVALRLRDDALHRPGPHRRTRDGDPAPRHRS